MGITLMQVDCASKSDSTFKLGVKKMHILITTFYFLPKICSKIDTFISACVFLFTLICEQQYQIEFPNSYICRFY